MEFIIATKNMGKIREIKQILLEMNCIGISMEDYGYNTEILEDGETFEENALKKAKTISEITKKATVADDSGLEIDFLDKKPGVYSARYLGEETPYSIKNNKILELMKDVSLEKRTARFISAIAVAFSDGRNFVSTGVLEGIISQEAKGEGGFGYDPIFYINEFNCTTAELSMEEKNKISHRAKALKAMKIKLEEIL